MNFQIKAFYTDNINKKVLETVFISIYLSLLLIFDLYY